MISDTEAKFVKLRFRLLAFVIIFMLAGLLFVSVAMGVVRSTYVLHIFLHRSFFSAPTLLLISGGLLFLISLLGAISTYNASTRGLTVFTVVLSSILVLQMTTTVSVIFIKGSLRSIVSSNMNASLGEYAIDVEVKETIDFVQSRIGCCGVRGPSDWKDVFTVNENYQFEHGDLILPDSCCKQFDELKRACLVTHSKGCLSPVTYIVSYGLRIMFFIAMGFAIFEAFGIYCSICLIKCLIMLKSERTAQQIQSMERTANIINALGMDARGRNIVVEDKPPSYDELERYYGMPKRPA